jgi:hypothetical protein
MLAGLADLPSNLVSTFERRNLLAFRSAPIAPRSPRPDSGLRPSGGECRTARQRRGLPAYNAGFFPLRVLHPPHPRRSVFRAAVALAQGGRHG